MMSINIPRINLKNRRGLLLVFLLAVFWIANNQAQAAPRGVDVFSVNAHNQPSANDSASNPALIWFDKFDKLREQYHPSEKDKVILTRPLMQSAERVQQFTNTASKISKNYMLLSKSIRSLTVPPGMSDIKEYRDLMADWFQDSAGVYTDLIRPRPPAKTIEDLQEELDAVKKRSEGLANNMANLKTMERQVREAHKVPTASQDDALQQFVRGK